jgi:hypothetical protein
MYVKISNPDDPGKDLYFRSRTEDARQNVSNGYRRPQARGFATNGNRFFSVTQCWAFVGGLGCVVARPQFVKQGSMCGL